ncbi:hypothetical protein ABIA39_002395 [Nocardia sp. GAS34]|uniref:hypothetical protein n=1 Tax=unclassified Nocardia TaxID=2637762 RepID=UPI003D2482AE
MRCNSTPTRDIQGSLRGVLVGPTVAALAVAAHGLAGGGYPGSAALTLLLFTAAGIGAIANLLPAPAGMSSRAALLAVLGGGQLAAHAALSVAVGGDSMGSMAMGDESAGAAGTFLAALHLPTGPMAIAHVLATLVCTALILATERLYGLVTQTIRIIVGRAHPIAPHRGSGRWPAGSPTSYRFLRAGALGSRAPPVPA